MSAETEALIPRVSLRFNFRGDDDWDEEIHYCSVIPRVGDEVWVNALLGFHRVENVALVLPNEGAREPRLSALVSLAGFVSRRTDS